MAYRPSRPAARGPALRFSGPALAGALALATALGGCATATQPSNQELALRTTMNGERHEASCDLGNDKASWNVIAPVDLLVTRSDKPLSVECHGQNGTVGTAVLPATRDGSIISSDPSGYAYPDRVEVTMTKSLDTKRVVVGAGAFAPLDDASRLPHVDASGRAGYERFLAGASPRAFAISEKGTWVRVNAARGAARAAIERCQALGGRCRLYAVDDQVVWDQKVTSQLVASN